MQAATIPWLRAEIERCKARLQDLDEFEVIWDRYVTALQHLVAQLGGRDHTQITSDVYDLLPAAEELRVQVLTLGPVKFDSNDFWRVEFSTLTQPNLRTQPEKLFAKLLEAVPDEVWDPGEPRSIVTRNALDAIVGEANGLINRKREKIKQDVRQKQLYLNEKVADDVMKAPSGEITAKALFAKWARKVKRAVGDIVGGALKDQLKKGIQLAVVIGLAVLAYFFAPNLVRKARQGWSQLKSDTVQVRTDSVPGRPDSTGQP